MAEMMTSEDEDARYCYHILPGMKEKQEDTNPWTKEGMLVSKTGGRGEKVGSS